jgi:hypothetical protein
MEKSRKNLKVSSMIVLLFAGLTVLELISELMFGELNNAAIPDGAPDNILLITKIFLLSFTVLLLLPQIYIGIKGLIIAKKPNRSKGHIVWAVIILVLNVIGLFNPVVNIITGISVFDNVRSIFSILLEVVIFYEYIKYAREVRKGC